MLVSIWRLPVSVSTDGGVVHAQQVVEIAQLGQLAVVSWPRALGEQQDNLFEHAGKDTLLKEDQSDSAEVTHEEGPHSGGVVDGEQLRRQNQSQPAAVLQKQRSVHDERGPRGRQVGERDSATERGRASGGARVASPALVADIGRVADHGVEARFGDGLEEVFRADVGVQVGAAQKSGGVVGAGLV